MSPGRRDKPLKPPTIKAAVQAVGAALSDLPVPGMVIGGIAVIARGVPRVTRDVDVTVEGGILDLTEIIDRLRAHDIVPRIDDVVEFARVNQVLLLRHAPSGVDVDLSIAWLPFEREALAAAEPVEMAGRTIPVTRAEDLVIYKALAFRPQDQQDIERLLALYGTEIDLDRVRRTVAEFAQAMEESERTHDFERLVERAGLV